MRDKNTLLDSLSLTQTKSSPLETGAASSSQSLLLVSLDMKRHNQIAGIS